MYLGIRLLAGLRNGMCDDWMKTTTSLRNEHIWIDYVSLLLSNPDRGHVCGAYDTYLLGMYLTTGRYLGRYLHIKGLIM